jgi:GGDEF domain-containing protein
MPLPRLGRSTNFASSDFSDVSPDGQRCTLGVVSAGVVAAWVLSLVTFQTLFVPVAVLLAAFAVRGGLAWTQKADKREEQARRDLNEQLEKQVRVGKRIAIRDGVSTLLHRWYFELRVAEEASRCQRYGTSMAILFAQTKPGPRGPGMTTQDLEVEVAQTFTTNLRSVDLAAKVGEWQYAVCLPQTDEAGARVVASRVLNGSGAFAFAAGLAMCPRDGLELETLLIKARASQAAGELEVADERYYQADAEVEDTSRAAVPIEDKLPVPATVIDLVQVLANKSSGELPIEEGSSARTVKATLRRASRKAGVELKIWERDGVIFFERIDVTAPASDVA